MKNEKQTTIMNKPTLKDFLSSYNKAILDGYVPTFMCVGALVANTFSLQSFYFLLGYYYRNLLNDKVSRLLPNLVQSIIGTFYVVTIPILFPFWWGVFFIIVKKDIKRLKRTGHDLISVS